MANEINLEIKIVRLALAECENGISPESVPVI